VVQRNTATMTVNGIDASAQNETRVFPNTAELPLSKSNLASWSEQLELWDTTGGGASTHDQTYVLTDVFPNPHGGATTVDEIGHNLAGKPVSVEARQSITVSPNTVYNVSIFGRRPSAPDQGTHTAVAVSHGQFSQAMFNMDNGGLTDFLGSVFNVQTTQEPNGFYRVSFSTNTGAAQTMTVLYRVGDGPDSGDTSYSGTSEHSMYWSGMQVSKSSLVQPYTKTTSVAVDFRATVQGTTGVDDTDVTASLVVMPLSGNNVGVATGNPIANYPFVTAGFAIGNGSHRRENDPWATNFASKNFAIHQMIVFSSEAGREANYGGFENMSAINPYIIHIPHIDNHGIEFDPPNAAGSGWFCDDYVHDRVAALGAGEFDKIIATGVLDRAEYTGGPYTVMQSFDHELGYRWDTDQATHEYIVEGYLASWTNNYDTRTRAAGGVNLARDFKFGIMQDTFAQNASNGILWFPEFEGSIDNILNSNEFRIGGGSWAYPTQVSSWDDHFGGTADGDGYYPPLHDVQVVIVSSNRLNSSSDNADGYNPTTGRIRLEGTPNYTYANGDDVWIKIRQFQVQPTDRTSNQWDRDGYHNGGIFFLEGYNDQLEAAEGFRAGIYSNQVSQNVNTKLVADQADRETMPVALWQGKWDGLHWEWMDEQLGFTSDSSEVGYWVKNSLHGRNTRDYDIDFLVYGAGANTPLLKPNAASPTGYPCLWADISRVRRIGDGGQDPGRYTQLTDLDAAFVRFYSLLCWCCENLAPQPEMGPHADPVMIDEELIEAGDPITPRNLWENYDPLGDLGRGSWDWKTPDFGTHGYLFEFENCLIQINVRTPDDPNIAWIPSWMEGGQPIDPDLDRAILPPAGDGFKWQAFNRATYVNNDSSSQFFGKTPSDYDATYILSDANLNNGADRNGYFDTGALEAVVHMRVPTTENPVTVYGSHNRYFYYKENPLQLFGHQHIRINVDQATEKDMPAVMGPSGSADNDALRRYLDICANRGFNNIRLWPYFSSDTTNAAGSRASPLPWNRPGPGTAGDGGSRFDLNQLNQEYFDRIETICEECYNRDIIVTVLFWDVYSFGGTRQDYNPMTNRAHTNNINSVEVDANNTGVAQDNMYEEPISADVTAIQVAYERKLIDTVNRFPNIIYEVNNEMGRMPHQETVMDRVRAYQAGLPNQHLVGITAGGRIDTGNYTQTDVGKTAVKATTCDYICPGTDRFGATWGDTDDSSGTGPPLQDDLTRPWYLDMDHIQNTTTGTRDPSHFWKSLCRGYGYNNFESNFTGDPALSQPYSTLYWEAYMNDTVYGFNIVRRSIGTGRKWLNDLCVWGTGNMQPTTSTAVCSTGYCIRNNNFEYIGFTLTDSTPTIGQLLPGETYVVKWYDPTNGVEEPGVTTFTASSTSQTLTAPFTLGAEGAAFHVWRTS
jgi:hypothetical protein